MSVFQRTWRAGLYAAALLVVMFLLLVVPVYALDWPRSRYFFGLVGVLWFTGSVALPVATLLLAGVHGWRWRRTGLPAWRDRAVAFTIVAVLLGAVRLYAGWYEPRNLKVRTVVIETPRVTAPIRVLHVSDIQTMRVTAYEARAVEVMRSLEPDLIIHTGDLLHTESDRRHDEELVKMAELFMGLNPPLGFFSVEGDTDRHRWRSPNPPVGTMRWLANEDLVINTPAGTIAMHGMRLFPSGGTELTRWQVDGWLERVPEGAFTILIGHRPDYVLEVQDLPIDLCLAGHTHGGQIRLPLVGALWINSRVPRSWGRGFREVGSTRLNVSAGVGAEHALGLPSIRFLCPPEMTLIELRPPSNS